MYQLYTIVVAQSVSQIIAWQIATGNQTDMTQSSFRAGIRFLVFKENVLNKSEQIPLVCNSEFLLTLPKQESYQYFTNSLKMKNRNVA